MFLAHGVVTSGESNNRILANFILHVNFTAELYANYMKVANSFWTTLCLLQADYFETHQRQPRYVIPEAEDIPKGRRVRRINIWNQGNKPEPPFLDVV